ncbi:MAG: tetratricopeptide repeat protein [Gammaproteobacteria bacterium]
MSTEQSTLEKKYKAGVKAQAENNFEGAIEHFEEALTIHGLVLNNTIFDKFKVEILYRLGSIYLEQGKIDNAQDCFKKALETYQYCNINYWLGYIFQAEGNIALAKAHPKATALFKAAEKAYTQAIAEEKACYTQYTQAITNDTTKVTVQRISYSLGCVRLQLGLNSEAQSCFESALENHGKSGIPSDLYERAIHLCNKGNIHHALARAYRRQREFSDARKHLNLTIEAYSETITACDAKHWDERKSAIKKMRWTARAELFDQGCVILASLKDKSIDEQLHRLNTLFDQLSKAKNHKFFYVHRRQWFTLGRTRCVNEIRDWMDDIHLRTLKLLKQNQEGETIQLQKFTHLLQHKPYSRFKSLRKYYLLFREDSLKARIEETACSRQFQCT